MGRSVNRERPSTIPAPLRFMARNEGTISVLVILALICFLIWIMGGPK